MKSNNTDNLDSILASYGFDLNLINNTAENISIDIKDKIDDCATLNDATIIIKNANGELCRVSANDFDIDDVAMGFCIARYIQGSKLSKAERNNLFESLISEYPSKGSGIHFYRTQLDIGHTTEGELTLTVNVNYRIF